VTWKKGGEPWTFGRGRLTREGQNLYAGKWQHGWTRERQRGEVGALRVTEEKKRLSIWGSKHPDTREETE